MKTLFGGKLNEILRRILTKAEKAKEEGNKCMLAEKYVEAMMHYTEAVKIDPKMPALYSNRSLAFLKMQQYYLALEDAKMAIKLEPKWPKGYYRLGEVQFQVELYKDALWSYKQASNFFPGDEKLQAAVNKAKDHYYAQLKAEKRMPVYGVIIGMLAGILIAVADQIATKQPVLQHVLLQGLFVLIISAICYAGATFYVHFLRNQRKGLLEPPIDLTQESGLKPKSSSNGNVDIHASSDDVTNKTRKRVSTANAKHKQRQAAKS